MTTFERCDSLARLKRGVRQKAVARVTPVEGTRGLCQGVERHEGARTEYVRVGGLPLLAVGRYVASTPFKKTNIFRAVVWDPTAALEVGIEDANKEDILCGVLEELLGERPLQPHVTSPILVHLHHFGFNPCNQPYSMRR